MTVYLALSCLQGRPAVAALDDLLRLEPDGIQLTAGCVVPRDFEAQVLARDCNFSLHHAFDWTRYKRQVWDGTGQCVALPDASVHAPPRSAGKLAWITTGHAIETMFPGDPIDYSALPWVSKQVDAGVKPWACDVCSCFWITAMVVPWCAALESDWRVAIAAGPGYTGALIVLRWLQQPAMPPPPEE